MWKSIFTKDIAPCLVLPAKRSLIGILHNNGLRHSAPSYKHQFWNLQRSRKTSGTSSKIQTCSIYPCGSVSKNINQLYLAHETCALSMWRNDISDILKDHKKCN
jgi:hypothetical protein